MSAVRDALVEMNPAAVEAAKRMSVHDDVFTVCHITDHDRSTKEILLELCVFRDRLFGVGYGSSDDNCVWLVDPVQNRIESIEDSELPDVDLENARMAATESCLYVYAPDPGDGDPEHPAGALIHLTYGEEAGDGKTSGRSETEEADGPEAEAAGFAAAYHTIIYPMAVMSDGTLYVSGMDETAPDIMFFRSSNKIS